MSGRCMIFPLVRFLGISSFLKLFCLWRTDTQPQTTTRPTTHNHHDEVQKNGIPYSGPQLKQSCCRKPQNDRSLDTEGYFTYYKNSMGQIMKHNTSHDAVLTKFRPTMARMTGADTPTILNLLPSLWLICPPVPINWIKQLDIYWRSWPSIF